MFLKFNDVKSTFNKWLLFACDALGVWIIQISPDGDNVHRLLGMKFIVFTFGDNPDVKTSNAVTTCIQETII